LVGDLNTATDCSSELSPYYIATVKERLPPPLGVTPMQRISQNIDPG